MSVLPKISIVVITLNNGRSIKECAQSIQAQDYPRELIEYINIDGGSTDETGKILKKYGFNIVSSPIKRNAEAQRAIGLKIAKNNLIVSLDADNYLPRKDWLRQMVKPFLDDPKTIHAGTLHYTYREKDVLLNRYCSLFGVLDPIVYYIGRPDRLAQNRRKWTSGNVLKETKEYYVVEFTKETLPTVGCNGVIYRRDIILNHAKSDPSNFMHIDVFADLMEKGFNRFAVVKNDVIHDTAVNLPMLMKKRMNFLSNYYLQSHGKRRYLIYNSKKIGDTIKLLLFIIYTVTWMKPVIDSIRGYRAVRDTAWFLHPIICWIYLLSYASAIVKMRFFALPLYEKK